MDLQARINIAQHMDGPAYWEEMVEIRRQMRQIQPRPMTLERAVFTHIKPRPIEEQAAAFLLSYRAAALSEKNRAYLEKLARVK
jgi:hypothetical protein